jgi:hypothetical protein
MRLCVCVHCGCMSACVCSHASCLRVRVRVRVYVRVSVRRACVRACARVGRVRARVCAPTCVSTLPSGPCSYNFANIDLTPTVGTFSITFCQTASWLSASLVRCAALCASACVCERVRLRALCVCGLRAYVCCVRAWMRACVRVDLCVCVCVRACVRVSV